VIADKRIRVAGDLPASEPLRNQMKEFRAKAPPKDALSDWRPATQADLASSLMSGLWWGERMLRSLVRQPPAPRLKVDPAQPPTFNQLLQLTKHEKLKRAS
jgi:hypothetical protein